jgi:thioredoxin reductase
VRLYCDGKNYLNRSEKQKLESLGIEVVIDKIEALEERNERLTNVLLLNGKKQRCDALFFVNGYEQQCNLIKNLGCVVNKKGTAISNRKQQTNIPGLYIAGDVSRDVHFVIVAAAEGAKAGVCINQELQQEEMDALVNGRIG